MINHPRTQSGPIALICFLLAFVLALAPQTAMASAVLDQSNEGVLTGTAGAAADMIMAQTFTPAMSGALTRVQVSANLFIYGTPGPGDLTVEIRTTSGGLPTGTVLGTATFPQANVPTGSNDYVWADFNFTNLMVTAGTPYAIVLRSPNPSSTGKGYYQLAYMGGNPYTNGRGLSYNLGSWSSLVNDEANAEEDLLFRTYVDVDGGPKSEISTLSNLVAEGRLLSPAFSPGQLSYTIDVGASDPLIRFMPTTTDPNAVIRMTGGQHNNIPIGSGSWTPYITLNPGPTTITFTVTAEDAIHTTTYTVVVRRMPSLTLSLSPSSIGYKDSTTVTARLTTDGSAAMTGKTISFSVNGQPIGSATTDAGGYASLTYVAVQSGSPSVQASFAGDADYSATTAVASLQVSKPVLTVTTNPASRIYGEANPTFTGSVSGLLEGDSVTFAYETTATAASPVGQYNITATPSGDDQSNYTIEYNLGKLTIEPATLTVTANDATRAYGAADPSFAGSIDGTKNEDAITATYATTAVNSSPVGTYPITANLSDPGGKLGNYTVFNTSGTLTITKASLAVTPEDLQRVYGSSNPTLSAQFTGLRTGDTVSAELTTAADTGSLVGTYPITVLSLDDPDMRLSNYTITQNQGTLTVTPAPLAVSVDNQSRLYGAPNPALTGTLTGLVNGDSITASYNTTATETSGVGAYTITATLSDPDAKLGNYQVTNTPGTLQINPAPVTILVDDASREYGSPDPSFTGSITGALNGDALSATYTTTATAASAVGSYPITATLSGPAAGNYTAAVDDGSLLITAAHLTVTPADARRFYGDPNPTFTGSMTGVKNGDAITPTYATDATETSAIGPYTIAATVDGAALSNYTVSYNTGVLTVDPAPLTIAPNDASRPYGDANPTFTGSLLGVKNSDIFAVEFSTTATETSPAGPYPIAASLSGPALDNYTVNAPTGTLTITAAPLTLAVEDATRAYGDANPAFTSTLTGIRNDDAVHVSYTTTASPGSPVGSYSVTGALSGDALGNYDVTYQHGTLQVTPAPLSATADDTTRRYGDANPAFSGNLLGLKNDDPITPVYATTADALSPVGDYPITVTLDDPSGALANYTPTLGAGSLTIDPAPLEVTPADMTRLFGQENPVLTGTITGLKNGDRITPVYSTIAESSSAAGSYPITVTLEDPDLRLPNYAVTLNQGTLTVSRGEVVIRATSQSKTYGSPNPPLTGTVTGMLPSAPFTVSYVTGASSGSSVGTYKITPVVSGDVSGYNLTVQSGTLTIHPARVYVTADDKTKVYGDQDPAFTVTYSGFRAGDTATALSGSLACTTGSGSLTRYQIVCSGLQAHDYSITYLPGTLTVLPRPTSTEVQGTTVPYGAKEARVSVSVSASGLVPESGNVTFWLQGVGAVERLHHGSVSSALDVSSLLPGTYTIRVAYDGDGMFADSYGTGTLTIPAPSLRLAAQAPEVVESGQAILLRARVSPMLPALADSTVQFEVNGQSVGSAQVDETGSANLTGVVVDLPEGAYTVTAVLTPSHSSFTGARGATSLRVVRPLLEQGGDMSSREILDQVMQTTPPAQIEQLLLSKVESNQATPGDLDLLAEVQARLGKVNEALQTMQTRLQADPTDLDAYRRYIELEEQTGEHRPLDVFVNGQKLAFDIRPVVQEGRTLVPIRALSEALGAAVAWDGDTRKVTITRNGLTVELVLGSNVALVNGQEVTLDVPADAPDGRTLVPIRFVSETFGLDVEWLPEQEIIVVIEKGDQ